MRNKLTLTLLFLLLPLTIGAKKWRADNLEMVHLKDSTQYVCNPDGILGNEAVRTANRVLRSLEVSKGVETVVVVVRQLEGDDPFTFGMDLARRYGIGNQQNTGLIVILATEDRSYQILTGHGLEGTLPDAICHRVEDRIMVPRLKKQEWDAAIVETVKALDQIIRGDESIVADHEEETDLWEFLGICLLVITGSLVFIILLLYFNQKNCPKCGAKRSVAATRTQRLIVNNRRRRRITWRCKKCGHTYTTESDDNDFSDSGGPARGAILMGGPHHRSGGFGGGSFGGGSFGGGGAGGRF